MWCDDMTIGIGRRWVAKASLCLVAFLLVGSGAYLYGREPGLPLRIELVATEDPHHIRAVTRMTIRLTNTGFVEIEPVFSVFSFQAYPTMWGVVRGPNRLSPRSAGVYELEADTLEKAIPINKDIVIRVNHAHGHLFTTSRAYRATIKELVALANPDLTEWILDPSTAQMRPFGWDITGIGGPVGEGLGVARATIAGRTALVFHVTHSARVQGWRGVHVRQGVEDPRAVARLFADGLSLWVYPTYDYAANPGGWPFNVFGIEINADNRLLWVVFSDKGAGRYVLPNQTIVVLHAPVNVWSQHYINLRALYSTIEWTVPDRIEFVLLAGTTHERPGTFKAAFGAISLGADRRADLPK